MMRNGALRHAAAFHAVARTGSIAAAAKEIGKSAPAVHHDLKLMETELGRPLFVKSGRSLHLAPGARELFESIGRSLDDIERARQRFQLSHAASALRIGTVSGYGRYRLAPKLFRKADANQSVELIMGSHEQILQDLLEHRCDVAVTYKPTSSVPIEARPLETEQFVMLAPQGRRLDLSLPELEKLNFITYDEYEYVFGNWFQVVFGRQPKSLRRLDHVSELEEAMESVAAARGVTIAPADAWQSGPWLDRCQELVPPHGRPSNMLYALNLGGSDSSAVSFLLELLAAPDRDPQIRQGL